MNLKDYIKSVDKDCTEFKEVNPNNALIVRDMEAWLAVWQQGVAYYWSAMRSRAFDPILHDLVNAQNEKENACAFFNKKDHNVLFYLLNKLGIKNMKLVPEREEYKDKKHKKLKDPHQDWCVALLPYEKVEFPYIVKLKIATNLPSPTFNNAAAMVAARNGWEQMNLNLTITIPPRGEKPDTAENLTILSDYVAFKGYFPFAHSYDQPYDYEFITEEDLFSTFNLTLVPKTYFPNYEQPKVDPALSQRLSFITDMQQVMYNSMQYELRRQQPEKQETAPLVGGVEQDQLAPGDRGGASGMTGDFAWMYFVPRMVSCNWNPAMFGTIKQDGLLNNYTQLLDQLGYTIPAGLNIKLHYAEHRPYNPASTEIIDHSSHNETNSGNQDWKKRKLKSFNEYASVLEVVLPAMPEHDAPLALANLIATRVDSPFTCG